MPVNRAKLTRKQIEKLHAVGFDFAPNLDKLEKVWEEKLERLKEYQAEHGGKTLPFISIYVECHFGFGSKSC